MTNGEEDRGPVTAVSVGTYPIGRLSPVMEGSRPFVKPMFLITRIDERISLDGLSIRRMKDRKRCEICGRGTRIQYKKARFWGYRKCRRHMTATEKALLFLMLTDCEAGGLTN